MSLLQRMAIGGAAALLIGAMVIEDTARRSAERRYRDAVVGRRQLELQFGEVLATHGQLKERLSQEQQRSQALGEELLAMRGKLEEAVGRLSDEMKTTRQLQVRLGAMQQQMDQLQGEVALSMKDQPASASATAGAQVQLERIVVSDGEAASLKGRVLSVHKNWNFVVIDLGWNTVRIGDVVSIFRNNELLAKARVDRVREGASAATLLPGWERSDVQINDLVRLL